MVTLFEMFHYRVCHNNMMHFEIRFDNGQTLRLQKRGGGGGGLEHHLYRTQNKDILSFICDSNALTTNRNLHPFHVLKCVDHIEICFDRPESLRFHRLNKCWLINDAFQLQKLYSMMR